MISSNHEFDHSLSIDTDSILFPSLLDDVLISDGQDQSSYETLMSPMEPSPTPTTSDQQQQQLSYKLSRRRLTADETRILNRVFERNPKPNGMLRDQLAVQLNMSPRNVQVWFQNRRAKARRDGSISSPMVNQFSVPYHVAMPQQQYQQGMPTLLFPQLVQQVPMMATAHHQHHQPTMMINHIHPQLLPQSTPMFFVNAAPHQQVKTPVVPIASHVSQLERTDSDEPVPRINRLDSTTSIVGSMEALDMFDGSLLVPDTENDQESDDIWTSLDKNINIHQTLLEMNALLPPTDENDRELGGFDVKRRKTIHHPFDAADIFDDLEFKPASIQRKYSI